MSEVGFETLRAPQLEGFGNFADVLRDEAFWDSLGFSLRFGTLTAVLEVALGLFLAVFLAPILQRHAWLLAILTLPMMVAPAMMGLMYRLVLHEFVGPVPHYLLAWFGTSPAFLAPGNVFWTVVVIEVLQWTPFTLLLFHLAYGSISGEIREAARMDGAKGWWMFRRVEFPMMLPTFGVALAIRFIDGVRVFDNIYVLTGAGAGGSTMSLPIYIYTSFFRGGNIGAALAASVLFALASFLILALAWRFAQRRPA
ncbi:Maltose/maltodextrin ABC transporter, permease protein MalF [Rubellimicrobium mesophilum DSM 19309]|uniref:Maltose/maltodextrin ABC transporter, permease protein MalF n=1 Tax=Rubellimicrobium mesophilum DSM 19309 TaxID=442562 RepID=A0A017HKU2_9RHOB|nr:Maltose/maltodextrin ABC transporter, permease protein MalF [Rubellimicrobium mesophilum DSM 19309]